MILAFNDFSCSSFTACPPSQHFQSRDSLCCQKLTAQPQPPTQSSYFPTPHPVTHCYQPATLHFPTWGFHFYKKEEHISINSTIWNAKNMYFLRKAFISFWAKVINLLRTFMKSCRFTVKQQVLKIMNGCCSFHQSLNILLQAHACKGRACFPGVQSAGNWDSQGQVECKPEGVTLEHRDFTGRGHLRTVTHLSE